MIKYAVDDNTTCRYAQKYCMPVIFLGFSVPFLFFVRASFLQNLKHENPGKLLWNVPCIHDTHMCIYIHLFKHK